LAGLIVSKGIRLTVAAVVERDGKFLCVEEHIDGMLRLNQPAGHLEPGESLLQGVIRETLEETAHEFTPHDLLAIYRWQHPDKGLTYVRVAFTGTVGNAHPHLRLDVGIERVLWMTLIELRACRARHRSPLVMRCVEDFAAGKRYPLDLLRDIEAPAP
jgi:8-oxo-dGTP pyrophosphatase MutT (NUDIX family)